MNIITNRRTSLISKNNEGKDKGKNENVDVKNINDDDDENNMNDDDVNNINDNDDDNNMNDVNNDDDVNNGDNVNNMNENKDVNNMNENKDVNNMNENKDVNNMNENKDVNNMNENKDKNNEDKYNEDKYNEDEKSDHADLTIQIFKFLETLESSPPYREIFYTFLEDKNYVILPKVDITSDICAKHIDDIGKDNFDQCLNLIQEEINIYCQEYFIEKGHHPLPVEIQSLVIRKISQFIGKPLDDISTFDSINRSKANKETGISHFCALCRESKTITSSVDMYNNYRKWCAMHGYGYYSSPTLTKFFRDSDKKLLESVSEKGRSQGWYLFTP